MANLTKTVVDAAQPDPSKAQIFLWDDRLRGFGLRVTQSGVKSYVIEYRPKGSTQSRRHTIGRHGKITAEKARKLAEKLFADIVHGADPAAVEQAAKAEITVGKLLDQFVKEHVNVNNKPSTAYRERSLIEKHLKPALGGLKLSKLTTGKVREFHSSLVGTRISANRALAHLRRACRFAIEHGMITSNPCAAITRYRETPRDRFFSDDELIRIGAATRALCEANTVTPSMADAIRLIALTGLRAGEVRTLQWDDFDRTMRVLRLRDAKTGARAVVLSEETFALLSGIERRGAFIVGAADPDRAIPPRSFARGIELVLARAKVTDGSAHTFRHTVATYMAQNGDSAPMIAAMGGWKTLAMVQRYVNLYAAGKRHPLSAGKRIAAALEDELAEVAEAA